MYRTHGEEVGAAEYVVEAHHRAHRDERVIGGAFVEKRNAEVEVCVVLAEQDLVRRAIEDTKDAAPHAGTSAGGRRGGRRVTCEVGAIGRRDVGRRLQPEQGADHRVAGPHCRRDPGRRPLLEESPGEGIHIREPPWIDTGAKGIGVIRERAIASDRSDEGSAGHPYPFDRETQVCVGFHLSTLSTNVEFGGRRDNGMK